MGDIKKTVVFGALVLAMLMASGCTQQYSLQQDWDHIDFEKLTKPPTSKKA